MTKRGGGQGYLSARPVRLGFRDDQLAADAPEGAAHRQRPGLQVDVGPVQLGGTVKCAALDNAVGEPGWLAEHHIVTRVDR